MCESEDFDRFSISARCHVLLHPIALHGEDNRLFVDAVLWLARAGAPWRDLPEEFGHWNSVFQRFRRWAKKGVWERIFKALVENPDFEYLIIDSTIVRAHQHAAGAKGGAKMRRSGVRAAA